MDTERCYVCGRTGAEVAQYFDSQVQREKDRVLNHEYLRADEPNHTDVYSEEEYNLAKACTEIAEGLLSTALDQYDANRDSLSSKYKGIETVDQLLRVPFRRNSSGIGNVQKTVADRVAVIIRTYEKAREVETARSHRRAQIETGFDRLYGETEWLRQVAIQVPQPKALRKAGPKMYSAHLSVTATICIACAAWEPDLQALKNNPYPS